MDLIVDMDTLELEQQLPAVAAVADDGGLFGSAISLSHGTQGTLGGNNESVFGGVFGSANAPGKDAVLLVVLAKEEHGISYCGGCIGKKTGRKTKGISLQDRMYIKADCKTRSHKDNMWISKTLATSPSGRYVFICVKLKEDMVWTATTLPFEAIARDWHQLQDQ